MWWILACGPAELVFEGRPEPSLSAAGAGDRLWWSDGAGVVVADPTDGATWGRWEGQVEALAADRAGVWVASGEALVRLDGRAAEVARWSEGSEPRLFADAEGAWVGWTEGALWRCAPDTCHRSPWRGPVAGLVATADGVVTFDADAVRRVDPARSDARWTAPGGGSAATVARDTVVVVEAAGVAGLSLADGATRWTFPLDRVALAVAVGGWAIVADADAVTALGAASGRPRWRRALAGVRALAAGPDWTVAAWDGETAHVIDVPTGESLGELRSDTPPVALPCGWAVVEGGVAGCYRW